MVITIGHIGIEALIVATKRDNAVPAKLMLFEIYGSPFLTKGLRLSGTSNHPSLLEGRPLAALSGQDEHRLTRCVKGSHRKAQTS